MPGGPPRRLPLSMTLPGMLLDALLPPRCTSCGRVNARWCEACRAAAPQLFPPLCPHCSQPVGVENQVCGVCRAHPPSFRQAVAWRAYGGTMQKAIQGLKFKRDVGLANLLAEGLAGSVLAMGWAVDVVAPVPLGSARLRQRGYNQAALIARPLAALIGARYLPNGLARVRETPPQVGLNVKERRVNVEGAFEGDARVGGLRALVVDDVMTTGATLDAAAAGLARAGAADVVAAAVARVV